MPTAAKGQWPSTASQCGPAAPTTDNAAGERLTTPGNPSFCRARHTYIRRRPEQTVLHQVVREHLETFLAETRLRGGGEGLPRFVERELHEFLTCGVMARGFARLRCSGCKLVAEGVFELWPNGSLRFVPASTPPTDVEVARLLVSSGELVGRGGRCSQCLILSDYVKSPACTG